MKSKIILFVVLAWMGFQGLSSVFSPKSKPDRFGFVPAMMPENAPPNQIIIFGAPNCNNETAERIRALVETMAQLQIPYQQTSDIRFNSDAIDDWDIFWQTTHIASADGPIVFINGKAKANPKVDEVIAQYKAMTGK